MNARRVFAGSVFIAYYIISSNGVRTGNRCIEDLSKSFTVQLQCPAGEWIHVVHEAYGDGDNATCRLKSAGSCTKLLASSHNGLVVSCNGKQSCREVMRVWPINSCNITDAAAEVKYNCIEGSMNMCSPVTTTVNGEVYLHSPGFPDSVGVDSSCVVRIKGQTVQITLLEQRMRSGMFYITGDGRQLWASVNVVQYNRVLPGTAAEIVTVYDNQAQDGSDAWIRVADSGQMNITITRVILDESTTPTSTHQPSHSQSMSGTNTSGTPAETTTHAPFTASGYSWNVVIALSVVCGILVLIIVVLIIYFMVVKPFRKKQDTSSNTETTVGHSEVNVYDGIQRNTSDAGGEHNYGHITSSGGHVYANSVRGDDPYVNA